MTEGGANIIMSIWSDPVWLSMQATESATTDLGWSANDSYLMNSNTEIARIIRSKNLQLALPVGVSPQNIGVQCCYIIQNDATRYVYASASVDGVYMFAYQSTDQLNIYCVSSNAFTVYLYDESTQQVQSFNSASYATVNGVPVFVGSSIYYPLMSRQYTSDVDCYWWYEANDDWYFFSGFAINDQAFQINGSAAGQLTGGLYEASLGSVSASNYLTEPLLPMSSGAQLQFTNESSLTIQNTPSSAITLSGYTAIYNDYLSSVREIGEAILMYQDITENIQSQLAVPVVSQLDKNTIISSGKQFAGVDPQGNSTLYIASDLAECFYSLYWYTQYYQTRIGVLVASKSSIFDAAVARNGSDTLITAQTQYDPSTNLYYKEIISGVEYSVAPLINSYVFSTPRQCLNKLKLLILSDDVEFIKKNSNYAVSCIVNRKSLTTDSVYCSPVLISSNQEDNSIYLRNSVEMVAQKYKIGAVDFYMCADTSDILKNSDVLVSAVPTIDLRTQAITDRELFYLVAAYAGISIDSSTYAFINVTYDDPCTCTCSDGVTTLTAVSTDGKYLFIVPNSGQWTLTLSNNGSVLNQKIITVEHTGQVVTTSIYPELLTNSVSSDIMVEQFAKSYTSGSDWELISISGSGYSKTVNTYDVLRLTQLSFAKYDLPSANHSVTVYALMNNYSPMSGDRIYLGVPYGLSSGLLPGFFINSSTIYTTVYGSGDTSTNQPSNDWHVLTLSVDAVNKIVYYYIDGVSYSNKSFTNSGSFVSFSAAMSASEMSCPADIAWLGIVDGAEDSQTVISNQQNIMQYFELDQS